MPHKTVNVIEKLARKLIKIPPPIHIIAICTGGRGVGQTITKYLNNKGIETEYYEAWTDIVKKKAKNLRTDFKKKDYRGTVVIVDDVIWSGRQLPPLIKLLKKMKPRKKYYIATLLDCNKKSDFCVFH